MSVVLVFLVVVIGFSLWWLVQQQLMSKPWLEVGPDPAGPESMGLPTAKIALGVFLAVVGALFALFASAYFMRSEFIDWQPLPLPRIVWLNTGLLMLASVALHCALTADRDGDRDTLRLSLVTAGVATLAFLAGQLVAWRELSAAGFGLDGGPASAFFYLLTTVHGVHILGGLIAFARTAPGAWEPERQAGFSLRLELCAMYWHFLLFVWCGLVVLLTGWANEVVNICRQFLT